MRQLLHHPNALTNRVGVVVRQATTHGTLPWAADYQRRSCLFRYSPANLAFAGGRHSFDCDVRSGLGEPIIL